MSIMLLLHTLQRGDADGAELLDREGVGDCEAVTLWLDSGDGVTGEVPLRVAVGVPDCVPVCEGVGDWVGVCVVDPLRLLVSEEVGLIVPVGVPV